MKRPVNLGQYTELQQAQDDLELLTKAGYTPILHEQPDENSEPGTVYHLQVPPEQSARALDMLRQHYESEKDQSYDILGDPDVAD